MNLAVIIPAAGSSRRYAESGPDLGDRSKLDEDLGGRPLLQRTVELFTKRAEVSLVIVAGPAEDGAYRRFSERYGDTLGLLGVRVCRGGPDHRYQSVAAALALVPDEGITHIAVHDAARPCASETLIDRVLLAAERHPAVVPALEVTDTLKRVGEAEPGLADPDPLASILGPAPGGPAARARVVEETLARRDVWAVQTPQVFAAPLLRRAYAQADLTSTDDSQLVERLGVPAVVVEGEPGNVKITRRADLELARAILRLGPAPRREAHKKF
ncbi:MAG TPA: IspD/TarI family cytidylyltransferase [Phycisphaerales bacterium]|nr:IspD/TarI family cytidylyltransferase [Phycisphaerales bacterium]